MAYPTPEPSLVQLEREKAEVTDRLPALGRLLPAGEFNELVDHIARARLRYGAVAQASVSAATVTPPKSRDAVAVG